MFTKTIGKSLAEPVDDAVVILVEPTIFSIAVTGGVSTSWRMHEHTKAAETVAQITPQRLHFIIE
jgi:hypothetical protein